MTSEAVSVINRVLDAIPRQTFVVCGRPITAYLGCAMVGICFGMTAMVVEAQILNLSLAIVLVLVMLALASFFVVSLLRWRFTGKDELVLLEHFLSILFVAWLLLSCRQLADHVAGDRLVYLDILVLGLSFFVAFGRLGCLFVGCCYGYESSLGIKYRSHDIDENNCRRRFPVQLLEIIFWLSAAVMNLVILGSDTLGGPVAATLTGYGVVRFMLEWLRGDPRPVFFGLNESQWLSVVSVAVGSCAYRM